MYRLFILIPVFLFLHSWIKSQPGNYWQYQGSIVFPDVINTPEKPGYKLVFQDEFEGPEINGDYWKRMNYFSSGSGNAATAVDCEYHVYPSPETQNNFAFRTTGSDTYLSLIAKKQPPPIDMTTTYQPIPCCPGAGSNGCLEPPGPTCTCNCGAEYRSFTTFAIESAMPVKFGYLEFRAKMPWGVPEGINGGAFWPALWLFEFDGWAYSAEGRGKEIDLLEILSNCPDTWYTTYHSYDWPCPCKFYPYSIWGIPGDSPGTYNPALPKNVCSHGKVFSFSEEEAKEHGFSEKFHTFGLEWEPERVYFYLDNHLMWSIENDCRVSLVLSKIIINLAVQKDYAGFTPNCLGGRTISEQVTEASLDVDYVRFYKKILTPDYGTHLTAGEWDNTKHTRMTGDADGDGRDDIIAVGESGVMVSLSYPHHGTLYSSPEKVLNHFSPAQGWDKSKHVVQLADVNGDHKQDIAGFGEEGVWVSFASGSPGNADYTNPVLFIRDMGNSAGGWNTSDHIRMTGDINGDGRDDVAGFGGEGVFVALANEYGFTNPELWINWFGNDSSAGAWRTDVHKRFMADVNGDKKKDIIGFYNDGVWVAVSTGNSFQLPVKWLDDYGPAQGWNYNRHLVQMGDADADGRADIIGFGEEGVYVSWSTGFAFTTADFQFMDLGSAAGGWNLTDHPRMMGDVTGDGREDIIGFGGKGVFLAEAYSDHDGSGFRYPRLWYNSFGSDSAAGGWNATDHLRLLTDMNGDGLKDVIGFGDNGVYGHESARCAEFDPSAGISREEGCKYDWNTCSWTGGKNCGDKYDKPYPGLFNQKPFLKGHELPVYATPSPNDGLFYLDFDPEVASPIHVRITDNTGKEVFTDDLLHPTWIDLRHVSTGVYSVFAFSGEDWKALKMVVMK